MVARSAVRLLGRGRGLLSSRERVNLRRRLWAGFVSHGENYPAQNSPRRGLGPRDRNSSGWRGPTALVASGPMARLTKSPSTVDFVKRAVQTPHSMPEPRPAHRKRPN
jgi:hypothetical protein